MLSDKKTKQVIEKNNLLETEELNKFEQQSGEKNQSLDEFLIEKKLITEEILYNSVANLHNLPFVNLKDKTIPKEVLFLIPEPISNSYQIIAFEKKPEYVSVAMTDPEDLQCNRFFQ